MGVRSAAATAGSGSGASEACGGWYGESGLESEELDMRREEKRPSLWPAPAPAQPGIHSPLTALLARLSDALALAIFTAVWLIYR